MKTAIHILLLIALRCLALGNEFFAMDNGLGDVKSLADKAALLKELDYGGVTWRPGNTDEAVREMSAKGVKVHALMMNLPVSKKEPPEPLPLKDIEALKGTGAVLWVQLTRKDGDDADAVRELRRLNAVAKPLGLPVAIYPHIGNHVESLEDALRVADLVGDDNVGVSLALCHQLKTKGEQDLAPLLKRALPKLFLVQISGAEGGDTKSMGWDKLIQPLGQGSYDIKGLLKTLDDLGYQGPVGVIGFGLKQPAREHLKQSIEFWQKMSSPAPGAIGSRQSERAALVFLIAGQSNAGGVAAFSPESSANSRYGNSGPTIPGSTAKEMGIALTKDGYPRSYFWKATAFIRMEPGSGYYSSPYPKDPNRHGIELPMAMLLEKQYPDAEKFFVKHGPGGHNLQIQWKAGSGPDYKEFMKQFNGAMADLNKRYKTVRVIGLYWDQGESDEKWAKAYDANLRELFAALRKDTGIADLQIFVREQGIFQHDKPDFKPIVDAQIKLCGEDPNAHLLTLDLGSNEKNFKAWAWTYGNGHLSSKAYLDLSKRIMKLTYQRNQ